MTADKYDAIARELEEQWERDQIFSMKVQRDMIAAALRQAAADERQRAIEKVREVSSVLRGAHLNANETLSMVVTAIRGEHE